MKRLSALLHSEMTAQRRNPVTFAALILFFLVVIILMPFALGPEPELLRRLAPGLIWLAALLMALLSLDSLFLQDARDGTLDLMLVSPLSLELIVLARLLAQMVTMIAALAVLLIPAAVLLNLDFSVLPVLGATFLLGVPSLVCLGGLMGAIGSGTSRHPALLTLLLAPFLVPVLIFAVAACDAAALGQSTAQPLLFLGAIETFLFVVSPYLIAGLLRMSARS